MMAYLLDSGFLYGFVDDKDVNYKSVAAAFATIREPVILPVPAITEVAYFISRNLGPTALADFLRNCRKPTLFWKLQLLATSFAPPQFSANTTMPISTLLTLVLCRWLSG